MVLRTIWESGGLRSLSMSLRGAEILLGWFWSYQLNGKQQCEYSHRWCATRAIWNVLIPNLTCFHNKVMEAIPLNFVIQIHISWNIGNRIVFILLIDILRLVPCGTSILATNGCRGQGDEQQKQSAHAAVVVTLLSCAQSLSSIFNMHNAFAIIRGHIWIMSGFFIRSQLVSIWQLANEIEF